MVLLVLETPEVGRSTRSENLRPSVFPRTNRGFSRLVGRNVSPHYP